MVSSEKVRDTLARRAAMDNCHVFITVRAELPL
jgi:hypothetical protein